MLPAKPTDRAATWGRNLNFQFSGFCNIRTCNFNEPGQCGSYVFTHHCTRDWLLRFAKESLHI
eukprot:613062-Pyramimonas_sp.AAC.1